MKKVLFYIVIFVSILTSCKSGQDNAQELTNILHRQEQQAMEMTAHIVELLHNNSQDSIWAYTQQNKTNNLFYIFYHREPVFWSNNWLSEDYIVKFNKDVWFYKRFNNAHAVCRWTEAGKYDILTVIPIKYAYRYVNQELTNTFIPPFNLDKDINIIASKSDAYPKVYSSQDRYLFSLTTDQDEEVTELDQSSVAKSFSYQSLLTADNHGHEKQHKKTYIYFVLQVSFYIIIVIAGIVGLIRLRGFKRMNIRTKIYYVINTLVLLASVYIFTVSTLHMRKLYESQARKLLENKTSYLQKVLQESYYWNISLSEHNSASINVELRDLSYSYETDICVYDLKGNLIGSSLPFLFDNGIISKHIAPQIIFSDNPNDMFEENIGKCHYMTSYTEFVNGNYVPIGYIAIPMFIYDEEIKEQVYTFLSKLVPANLIILLLSFIISFFIIRNITQPLSDLTENMQNLKIGQGADGQAQQTSLEHLKYDGRDEISILVARYNEMVVELEHSLQLLAKSEREGAWRTMARQIAHEINNPLTPMKLTIQQLQRTKKLNNQQRFDEYFDKSTQLLIEQIDNLSHIAQSFSQFAKIPQVKPEKVDIASRLMSVIALFRNNSANVPIRYVGAQEGLYAMADSEQISQVFNNIIKNALQAIENKEDGDIIVILQEKKDIVQISFSDNGSGIAEDVQEKIFRPNFTTKNTGMGLGLAISKNIIEGAGGTITFNTSPAGTTFIINLLKC